MFRKRERVVKIPNPAGELMMIIPKRRIYDPVAKQMDETQLSEFFWKFYSYTEKLSDEDSIRAGKNLRIRALVGVIDDINERPNSFLSDLNSNTNCFGVVNWDNFLADDTVNKIFEKTKMEYLAKVRQV